MASDTAIVLHGVEPVALCEFGRDAMLAVELILCRDVKHRVPVNCRVVLCGSCLIRRHRRRQVQLFSRFARNLGAIDQSITAHPYAVLRFGQIRHKVASTIIGHHGFDISHRQLARFCDHPHTRFRTIRTGHNTANVVVVNGDTLISPLLCV